MTWLGSSGLGEVAEVAVNLSAGAAVSDGLTGAAGSTSKTASTCRVGSRPQVLTIAASPQGC